MPNTVLALLLLVVAPYVILAIGAAALREGEAQNPSLRTDRPTVSVIVPTSTDAAPDALQDVLDTEYPTDRLEIIRVVRTGSNEQPVSETEEVPVRSVEIDREPGTDDPLKVLGTGARAAKGEVLLLTGPKCETSSLWIETMTGRCTPRTPIVVGPTLFDHGDLFLPRLQALQRLGRITLALGLQNGGIPYYGRWNLAVHRTAIQSPSTPSTEPLSSTLHRMDTTVLGEANAAVTCPSETSTFWTYLETLTESIGRSLHAPSRWTRATALGIWLTHGALLVACSIAIGAPGWRQPVLLLLLSKMGADAGLCVPAARHFGQRNLTRSIVPSELMLLLAVPFSGLMALLDLQPPAHS